MGLVLKETMSSDVRGSEELSDYVSRSKWRFKA
jgi:hypothetical protein